VKIEKARAAVSRADGILGQKKPYSRFELEGKGSRPIEN